MIQRWHRVHFAATCNFCYIVEIKTKFRSCTIIIQLYILVSLYAISFLYDKPLLIFAELLIFPTSFPSVILWRLLWLCWPKYIMSQNLSNSFFFFFFVGWKYVVSQAFLVGIWVTCPSTVHTSCGAEFLKKNNHDRNPDICRIVELSFVVSHACMKLGGVFKIKFSDSSYLAWWGLGCV